MTIERLAHDRLFGRDLFVLDAARPEDIPSRIELSSPRFVCLLTWDAGNVSVDTIDDVVRRVLDAGAVYIAVWGPDCGRVHDIVDEVSVGTGPDFESVGSSDWASEIRRAFADPARFVTEHG